MKNHGQISLYLDAPPIDNKSVKKTTSKKSNPVKIKSDGEFIDVLHQTACLGQHLSTKNEIYRTAYPKDNLKQIRLLDTNFDEQYLGLKTYLERNKIDIFKSVKLSSEDFKRAKVQYPKIIDNLLIHQRELFFSEFISDARTLCPDLGDHLYGKITNERGSNNFGLYKDQEITFLNH
jgi:hypothetical protein